MERVLDVMKTVMGSPMTILALLLQMRVLPKTPVHTPPVDVRAELILILHTITLHMTVLCSRNRCQRNVYLTNDRISVASPRCSSEPLFMLAEKYYGMGYA